MCAKKAKKSAKMPNQTKIFKAKRRQKGQI